MATISDVMEILEQISLEVMRLPARIKIAANQVTVTSGLGDISKRLGLVTAGEFRAGNDKEPGFGFSGVRIGYPPFSYNSEDWHVAGVNNDVLQVGFSAADGKLYAGGGVVVLDGSGVEIEVSTSLSYVRSYKFVDTNGVILGALAAYNTTANTTDISLATAGSRKAESLHLNAYTADTGGTGATFASVHLLAQADDSPDPHLFIYSDGLGNAYTRINANYADADTEIYGISGKKILLVDAGGDAVAIGNSSTNAAIVTGYALTINGKLDLTSGNTYDINGSPHAHNYLYSDISANDPSTDVTGAELEKLTDGSNADSLHIHSGLVTLETNTNFIFRCDAPGGTSAWIGTVATLPGGATLTYTTVTGTAGAMVPSSTSQLAKMRLYNTTRGDNALISNCVTGTSTITLTANVPGTWQVGDTITIASQTVTGAPISYCDFEITSGPTGKSALFVEMNCISTTPGDNMRLHPFEAFGLAKQRTAQALVASLNGMQNTWIAISSNVFSMGWTGTPANIIISEVAYL